MKTRLFFTLSAVMLFISCEKEKTDPRDAYIGTWQGTETQVYPEIGSTETFDVTYMITKGTQNNEIVITNTEAYEFTYTAIINDDGYSYKRFQLFTNMSGISVYFQLTGAGYLRNSQINENGNMFVSADGTDLSGTWYRTLTKK